MERPRLLCALIQELPSVPEDQSFVDSCEGCGRAVWRADKSNKRAIAVCRHCIIKPLLSGKAKMKDVQTKQRPAGNGS